MRLSSSACPTAETSLSLSGRFTRDPLQKTLLTRRNLLCASRREATTFLSLHALHARPSSASHDRIFPTLEQGFTPTCKMHYKMDASGRRVPVRCTNSFIC